MPVCASPLLLYLFTIIVLPVTTGQGVRGGHGVQNSPGTMNSASHPYKGAQPWLSSPIVQDFRGPLPDYSVSQFSAVELTSDEMTTGVEKMEHVSAVLGVYLPVDGDGDGIVDNLDGRPIYEQRDVRAAHAFARGSTGVVVGTYYLYYLYSLGGWAVHTTVGSEQAMLFCPLSVSYAHELHGIAMWHKVGGRGFIPDERIILKSVAQLKRGASGQFNDDYFRDQLAPADARLEMADPLARARLMALEQRKCAQGQFRDDRTGLCTACPRGKFSDSNDALSAEQCTACPAGKYSDRTGGRTVIDCSNCTAGKWTLARASLEVSGETACTGVCPLGKFGAVSGAKNNEEANCRRCPPGYRSEQCDRKENAHQIKRANDRERKLRLLRARQQSRQTSCSQGNEAATMRV